MAERTDKDYAIEHAEYMAQAAEHAITAVLSLGCLYQSLADGKELDDPEDIQNAEANVTEMLTGLRGAIYEFRKRRDRAARGVALDRTPEPERPLRCGYCGGTGTLREGDPYGVKEDGNG